VSAAARVAIDLLGGDGAPETVVEGALRACGHAGTEPAYGGSESFGRRDGREAPEIILVGPPDLAAQLLADRGDAGRFRIAPASEVVGMDEDPARAVRAKRDATVRVAARLVRDGEADAVVSVGSTGAAMAAALFTLGRVPGMTRPALAVVFPTQTGDVVLLDVGVNVECTPDLLGQFALAGSAYAAAQLDVAEPRVALLSIGAEAGKGDPLRKAAYALLSDLPLDFVGNVEGGDVVAGGRADVVVTDGFSGNVLLKGLEGAYRSMLASLVTAGHDEAVLRRATERLDPDALGGAVLLGVDGACVVGHGSASARAVASCIGLASRAVAEGVAPRTARALAELVARRRTAAGAGAPASTPAGKRP
jgi:glycerol-3-phosphate acyltransferase PlsX